MAPAEIQLIANGNPDDSVVPSQRCSHCCRFIEAACAQLGQQLDSMVGALDNSLSGTPLPQAAARHLRYLRLPMALYTCIACLSVALPFIYAGKSAILLATHGIQGKTCDPLEVWLVVCCMVLVVTALTLGVAVVLVIIWGVRGEYVRSQLPPLCEENMPEIWSFVDESLGAGVGVVVCALICAALACLMVRGLRRIHRLAFELEIRQTIESFPEDTPVDLTCAICLDDSTDTCSLWRRLPCNHAFHEQCLVDWSRRAQLCPICRQSYGREE